MLLKIIIISVVALFLLLFLIFIPVGLWISAVASGVKKSSYSTWSVSMMENEQTDLPIGSVMLPKFSNAMVRLLAANALIS